MFLLPALPPVPVSSQNKAVCGGFTEVLACLETLTPPVPSRGFRYKSSRRSQMAVVAVQVLAVTTRQMYGIQGASLPDSPADPQGHQCELEQEESSQDAESWHYGFT